MSYEKEYRHCLENTNKRELVDKIIYDEKEFIKKDKEIERLNKENNDLRRLYQRTYKHLFEKGNDELARYFQAQIDECRTFYVEPIIDYYEETKKLNNIIKEVREYITNIVIDETYTNCILVILDKGGKK